MGQEIERKFLVNGDAWRSLGKATRYRQGYLSTVKERTVRVRTVADKAYLTIKGVSRGITRVEFEYEIPGEDAEALLDSLVDEVRVSMQVTDEGEIDYVFRELSLGEAPRVRVALSEAQELEQEQGEPEARKAHLNE